MPLIESATLSMKFPAMSHLFHSLSDYDAHLFIRELGKMFESESIGVIAENKEASLSMNIRPL